MRRVPFLLIGTAVVSITLVAQGPSASFDVASIKRSANDGSSSVRSFGNGVELLNYTVDRLILEAYRLRPFQIAGGPPWIRTDRYDIHAKVGRDLNAFAFGVGPRVGEGWRMVQMLLADRFHLQVHAETRPLPVFALVFSRPDQRLGPHFRPNPNNSVCLARRQALERGESPPQNRACASSARLSPGHIVLTNVPIYQFVEDLSRLVDRDVIDQTGLEGGFDADLTFTATGTRDIATDMAASIFTALQEQLGLKLEAQRAPIEVLVIDHVERPTEN